MYGVDKAIATAVENCSKEEQALVYDIIRQNFLVGNSSSMTEDYFMRIVSNNNYAYLPYRNIDVGAI